MNERSGLKAIQHLIGAWAEISISMEEGHPLAEQPLRTIMDVVRQVSRNTDSRSWILCSKLLEYYELGNTPQGSISYTFFNPKEVLANKKQSSFLLKNELPFNVTPQGFRGVEETNDILGGIEQRITIEDSLFGGSVQINFYRWNRDNQNKITAQISCSNMKTISDEDVRKLVGLVNHYLS